MSDENDIIPEDGEWGDVDSLGEVEPSDTPLADEYGLEGPVYEDGVPKLSRIDLFLLNQNRYRLDAEVKEQELHDMRMDKKKREYNIEITKMANRQQALKKQIPKLYKEYQRLLNAFSEKYKMDFNKVSYDDEYGTINTLEDQAAGSTSLPPEDDNDE